MVQKQNNMKKFEFQSKEAFDFALEFSSKNIEERFSEFANYLLSQENPNLKAVDAIADISSEFAQKWGLEEAVHNCVYRIGKSAAINACTETAIELKKYQKETGINIQDLLDHNAKFAFKIGQK